ncbi:LysR family transcriptional regulator [Pseudochelatococcus sp. B33]
MKNINHFNLRSFDLNLLIAFDALMKDRSVTKAAGRLKVQQPALSHHLSSLRVLLDDELFIRVGNYMQPTAKAEALAEGVAQILAGAQALILAQDRFDPSISDRIFQMGFSCEELLILPALSERTQEAAPGLRFMARRVGTTEVGNQLDNAELDVAVGCYPPAPARYEHVQLFEQELACCYNPALIDAPDGIDLETYLSARHIFVSQQDDIQGCIGSMLTDAGHQLNIVLGVPEYLTALAAAVSSPLLVTVPLPIARRYASFFNLKTQLAPVELHLPPISLIWAKRSSSDAATTWLRDEIIAACAKTNDNRSASSKPYPLEMSI